SRCPARPRVVRPPFRPKSGGREPGHGRLHAPKLRRDATSARRRGSDVPLDPRLDEIDVREAGKLADRGVDAARRRAALGVAEEMARDESHVVDWTDAGADRRPEAIDQEPRDARRAGPREAPLRLLEVEREVARLVATDAREQLRQHGMAGALGEQLV